uniref:Uncharacterized protein n=1 Tax=Ditylenchus dipsaci TaxID=166011 RepID=A0A915ELT4_9BILA
MVVDTLIRGLVAASIKYIAHQAISHVKLKYDSQLQNKNIAIDSLLKVVDYEAEKFKWLSERSQLQQLLIHQLQKKNCQQEVVIHSMLQRIKLLEDENNKANNCFAYGTWKIFSR